MSARPLVASVLRLLVLGAASAASHTLEVPEEVTHQTGRKRKATTSSQEPDQGKKVRVLDRAFHYVDTTVVRDRKLHPRPALQP